MFPLVPTLLLGILLAGCAAQPPVPSQQTTSIAIRVPERPLSSAASVSSVDQARELTREKWSEVYGEYLSLYQSIDTSNDAEVYIEPLLKSSMMASTVAVPYEDEHIRFAIPYNPRWGWREFRLTPYWSDGASGSIAFGPLYGMEGGIGRNCRYSLRPVRSLVDAVEQIREACGGTMETCGSPERRMIGGNDVLVIGDANFGTTSAEIAGREKNVLFWCWNGSLDPILESIQLKS